MRSVTTKPPTTFIVPSATAASATILIQVAWCGNPATTIAPTRTMPFHASQLYARNAAALLQHLAPEGELALDWDDEITSGACVTRAPAAA